MIPELSKPIQKDETLDAESRATFRPFDPDGALRVYIRNLPHWRQPHATYFITFRQDDSIPAAVLAEWHDARSRWFHAHGLDPKLKDAAPEQFAAAYARIARGVGKAFEREQARMLHEELDRCHGSCVLRHAEPRREVVEALKHFHRDRLWLGDYVVMSNHIHAIIQPFDGWELEDLLGSIKKWTSRLIGQWLRGMGGFGGGIDERLDSESRVMHNKPRFWQYESYDRIIRDEEELAKFRRYIAENPVRAKLLPETYAYAAAEWLDRYARRPA